MAVETLDRRFEAIRSRSVDAFTDSGHGRHFKLQRRTDLCIGRSRHLDILALSITISQHLINHYDDEVMPAPTALADYNSRCQRPRNHRPPQRCGSTCGLTAPLPARILSHCMNPAARFRLSAAPISDSHCGLLQREASSPGRTPFG